jgi:hypothetical protein
MSLSFFIDPSLGCRLVLRAFRDINPRPSIDKDFSAALRNGAAASARHKGQGADQCPEAQGHTT